MAFFAGTRICVNCPMIPQKLRRFQDQNERPSRYQQRPQGHDHHSRLIKSRSRKTSSTSDCSELTQTPIRNFSIGAHHHRCHGKLTFLANRDSTTNCKCSRGLHFRMLPWASKLEALTTRKYKGNVIVRAIKRDVWTWRRWSGVTRGTPVLSISDRSLKNLGYFAIMSVIFWNS